MMNTYEKRLAMKRAGFSPIPVDGKAPFEADWQKMVSLSDEQLARHLDKNTGYLTRDNPGCDIDILDPEAAVRVEEFVKQRFEDRGGIIPVRVGRAPKRLLLFKTPRPFGKISADYVDPAGRAHRIEVLCDGQQAVVDGIHPDTGNPYVWHGGAPWEFARDDLVDVTGDEMSELLLAISEMLVEEFGFTIGKPRRDPKTNGDGEHRPALTQEDRDGMLAAMKHSGAAGSGINDTVRSLIPSRLQNGEHPQDIFDDMLPTILAADKADGEEWSEKSEAKKLSSRIICGFRLAIKDNDGSIPHWLPGEFHEKWVSSVLEGRTPALGYNGQFYLRGENIDADGKRAYTQRRTTHVEDTERPPATAPAKYQIEAKPFLGVNLLTLPPRRWLYGGHHQRGVATATVGLGGGGKSSLSLVEATALVLGEPLLSEQPVECGNVWYHNAEDPIEEIDRRIGAICQHYKIDQDRLIGKLFRTSGIDMPIVIADYAHGKMSIDKVASEAVVKTILHNDMMAMIIDPLVAAHHGVENATGDMDQVAREFARIANVTGCAIEIVHHTRKPGPGQEEMTVMDSRGAVALINAVRSARVLNTMTTSDAEKLGLDDVARRLHFKVGNGKANMAPPSAARWYEIASVDLPNGDSVGVVAAWDHPSLKTATDAELETAKDVFLRLLTRFNREGVQVGDASRGNFAPRIFANEAEAKVIDVTQRQLEEAMDALLRDKKESIVVDERFVLRVPSNLDLAGTAPLLCAGITTYSPMRHWGVSKGKKVGVVGLGGLGHMAVKFAHALGAHVVVFTTSPNKKEDAIRLGADEVVVSRNADEMQRHTANFDFILDAVSADHDINAYLNLLARDGTITLVGAPEKPLAVAAFSLLFGRRSLSGSPIGGIAETQEMLDFCGEHNITADVEVIPIQKVNEAYERLLKSDVKYRFSIDMDSLKSE